MLSRFDTLPAISARDNDPTVTEKGSLIGHVDNKIMVEMNTMCTQDSICDTPLGHDKPTRFYCYDFVYEITFKATVTRAEH